MKQRVFSERHERALKEKRISLSFRQDLRRAILLLLQRCARTGGQWDEENLSFDAVTSAMIERRGWRSLQYWDGEKMTAIDNFGGFIENATPHHLLDALELFVEDLHEKNRAPFVRDLNTLFDNHHSPVRYFDGEFYLIDSSFLESEVCARAQELLATNRFQGALEEFLAARAALLEKDTKRAVFQANCALESTMQAVLGVKKRSKADDLIKRIVHGNFLPGYFKPFAEELHKLLLIVPTTRDNEAGHGQGKEPRVVPFLLAELAVHLAGSLIVFLLKQHIDRQTVQADGTAEPDDDEIPF